MCIKLQKHTFFALWLLFHIHISNDLLYAQYIDTEIQTYIKAEKMIYDHIHEIKIFIGHAILNYKTLIITAHKIILFTNSTNEENIIAYATPSTTTNFCQKLKINNWYIGISQQIKYNLNTKILTLLSRVCIRCVKYKKITQEINGELVEYNYFTKLFSIQKY